MKKIFKLLIYFCFFFYQAIIPSEISKEKKIYSFFDTKLGKMIKHNQIKQIQKFITNNPQYISRDGSFSDYYFNGQTVAHILINSNCFETLEYMVSHLGENLSTRTAFDDRFANSTGLLALCCKLKYFRNDKFVYPLLLSIIETTISRNQNLLFSPRADGLTPFTVLQRNRFVPIIKLHCYPYQNGLCPGCKYYLNKLNNSIFCHSNYNQDA